MKVLLTFYRRHHIITNRIMMITMLMVMQRQRQRQKETERISPLMSLSLVYYDTLRSFEVVGASELVALC